MILPIFNCSLVLNDLTFCGTKEKAVCYNVKLTHFLIRSKSEYDNSVVESTPKVIFLSFAPKSPEGDFRRVLIFRFFTL